MCTGYCTVQIAYLSYGSYSSKRSNGTVVRTGTVVVGSVSAGFRTRYLVHVCIQVQDASSSTPIYEKLSYACTVLVRCTMKYEMSYDTYDT